MEHYYNQTITEVVKKLDVDSTKGLSSQEVEIRKEKYGLNKLESHKQKSLLSIFIEQFKSSMVVILFIAAIVSGVIGVMEDEGLIETIIILAILLLNAIIGTIEERRAQSSLEALNKMSAPRSKVLRDGQTTEISSTEIVPGDIVVLDTGDIIPADLRLIEAVNLKVQESALTGESVPVDKINGQLKGQDISLGDRTNMAFSTSVVTYGRGKGVIVGTGMNTEVGKIAHMLQSTDATETPMSKRLEQLGKTLGYIALIICALIFGIGMLYGNNWLDMFMMAVSLAVAAIPEGLQIVATIVLAIGVQRLVKQNAIVRTLPSVETLGSTTVICSDKTGTLTQNKMTVVETWTNETTSDFRNTNHQDAIKDNEELSGDNELLGDEELLITSALLCTDSHLKVHNNGEHELSGDPTETSIVELALKLGYNKNELENQYPRIQEIPFDSERKRMTTINQMDEGKFHVNVKGGLDEVLNVTTHILNKGEVIPITDQHKETIKIENERMAKSALRVLSVAYKEINSIPDNISAETIEKDLVFIGLLGMIDPARPEVIEAVRKCKSAGIRPVMITGDHKITAVAIADEIGIFEEGHKAVTGTDVEAIDDDALFNSIEDYSVYARVAPEHKVRIVKAWQKHGDIVAMTGDGVNDAPALKQADIGVAMAFAVLGFSQLFHVRNLHSNKVSSFKTSLLSNKSLLLAILASSILMLVLLMIPGVMNVFGLVPMDVTHWLYVLALSLVPIFVVELVKALKLNHTKDEY